MIPNQNDDAPIWRPATAKDLEAIQQIGDEIHVELPERPEVFAEKFRLFPRGCFVLIKDGNVSGYGFSHPWYLDNVPALDRFIGALPTSPECIFIHDVVVLPNARGRGATGVLVKRIATIARSLAIPKLALVSVYNTGPLWERFGFEAVSAPHLIEKLKSYGDTARYMVRKLD